MALLFLDASKEASRFSTSTSEAFIRITPNHSSKNSAVWGIDNENGQRCIYFGYGQEEEALLEKRFFIRDSNIGIGTSDPSATCTILNTNSNPVMHPVLNVQNTLYVNHEGTVSIQSLSSNQLSIHVPSTFYEPVEYKNTLTINGESLYLNSSDIQLGHSQSPKHAKVVCQNTLYLKGLVHIENQLTCHEPVFIKKDLTLHGNLFMLSDGYADSWKLKKELMSSSVVTKKLTVNGEGFSVQGGNVSLNSERISIGTPPSASYLHPDYLYISKHIELSSNSKIGIGKKPTSALDIIGNIVGDGDLTISKRMTIGTSSQLTQVHSIYGNMQLIGMNHLWKGAHQLDGPVQITQKCTIGHDYYPALLHVYGPMHVKENMYAHGHLYADNNVYMNGKLYFTAKVSRDESQVTIPSGSVQIQNGSLYVNTQPSSYPSLGGHALIIKGETWMDGSIHTQGSINIQESLAVQRKLTVHQETLLKKSLFVEQSIEIQDQCTVKGITQLQKDVFIKNQLSVEKDVYIGTTQESLLSVNGSCRVNQFIETPLLKTNDLELTSKFRYQNRRYGIRQLPQSEGYCMKWLHIPHRRGKTPFFVRMTGILYTSTSTARIEIELGGTTLEPNHKKACITGELLNEFNQDIFTRIQLIFYRNAQNDYIGCIRVPSYTNVGYEFDFEIDSRCDIFAYTPMDSRIPIQENWSIWWNILTSAHMIYKKDSIQIHRKVGIAEDNPLYMLDVKSDARFQGKLYQPGFPDVSIPTSIPSIKHNDTTYYAISDVLQWLIQSVQTLTSQQK
jgi:hypothetical protein